MTKPHASVPDDIAQQAKRVEDAIVEEASDPAAVLSLRSIHEAHTQNLEPLVRARVRTVLQLNLYSVVFLIVRRPVITVTSNIRVAW